MTDNAKFCMVCGAQLGDYMSGSAGIENNVIQRSQVGTSSVGNVTISPNISYLKDSIIQEGLCPKCGFKLTEQKPFSFFMPCENFGLIVDIKTPDNVSCAGFLCTKCGYKFLINSQIYSTYACPVCKNTLDFSLTFLSGEVGKCPDCGKKWRKDYLKMTKKAKCRPFSALEKMGWDVSFLLYR